MKKIFIYKNKLIALAIACMLFATGCEIDELDDPNNPSVDLIDDATLSELQNLITGVEAGMRTRLGTYYDDVGVIGREFYRFSGSDPRFTADLLGKGSSELDNNTFYITGPYAERYRVIKNTNFLLEAIDKTSAVISDAQKNYMRGYAKTIKAYQLLLNLNLLYQNGIRTNVSDPDNLGPFRTFEQSLDDIETLLNEAATELAGSEDEFIFSLSSGFAGFDDPAGFLQFNRAIAARVAIYQEDFTTALNYIDDSFYDLTGDLNVGPQHFYSTAGGDLTNPLFFPANASGETRVAHPSFVTDALPNDDRLSKVSARESAASLDNLNSNYDVMVYPSQSDNISIIRNEELILIYAEANARLGNTGPAVTAIDQIRSSHGLDPYTGGVAESDLINEILFQKRYSLFGEGHRWIDMRRYNKLNELPIDREGDDVWTQFPVPVTEAE
ncbi:RagB/SusD family nutrient uptake outer membrane protein [Fulvivirga sp. 29W222]|uniref:RagB/SusD family nutrient uptake outer membrane protein n=1 Tax=Fulvivirga marina TaxID=2494733 RepID=A0A937G2E5_9BACT|nr:RagB/SusD family nutrient uptake outer membrane protein [Fulvivirga marina]MBL6449233.1 RagB/SusD family nutrient uptake outer membrane protein [Fulvivirga marina]